MLRRILSSLLACCFAIHCAGGLADAEQDPAPTVRSESFNLETAPLLAYPDPSPSQQKPLALDPGLNIETQGLIDVYIQINSSGSVPERGDIDARAGLRVGW